MKRLFVVLGLLALALSLAGCDACGNFPWERYPAQSCRAGPPAQ
jgi:hypothetical protein